MHHRQLVFTLANLSALVCSSRAVYAQITPQDPLEDVGDEGEGSEEEEEPDGSEEDPSEEAPSEEEPVESEEEPSGETPSEEESTEETSSEESSSKESADQASEEDAPGQDSASASGTLAVDSPSELPEPGMSEKDSNEAAEAALVDAPSKGPSLTPFTVSTSTFSRFEYRQNYDALGVSGGRTSEGDLVVFRARLGFQTHPLALTDTTDVLLQFSPQASGNYGQNGTIGEANLGIYEGYFKLRAARIDIQVGRIMLDYGDALVIGNLDWNEKGRAFDGVRAHYKMDHGYVDFIGMQTREGQLGVTPVADESGKFLGGDHYFWGVYSGFGEYLADDLELEAYGLGLSTVARTHEVDDGASGTETVKWEGSNLFTLGARVKQHLGIFFYRAEAGVQFGTSAPLDDSSGSSIVNPENLQARDTFAYQADGELGLAGSHTSFSLGGLYASGDDITTQGNEGYNHLYPTAHKFLGLTDVIGARTNVLSGNAKLKQDLTEGLTVFVDGHLFSRPEEGALGSLDTGFSGLEFDAQLLQKIGKYVRLRGLYGMFIPRPGHYASDKLVSFSEVEAAFVF